MSDSTEVTSWPILSCMGLCTPIGLDAATTLAEYATGALQLSELDVRDRKGDRVRGSSLTYLAARDRTTRMAHLAEHAARDALVQWESLELGYRELPVFVGLPEDDGTGFDQSALRTTLAAVAPAGLQLIFDRNWPCLHGRAGFFVALERALSQLVVDGRPAVLVGAVDSLCDTGSLEQLVRQGRIQGDALDGLLPGEGAGFMVLSRWEPRVAQLGGALHVLGASTSRESAALYTSEPNLGTGLTTAFQALLAKPGVGRCQRVVTCQTGESTWGREFGAAYLRCVELMPEPFEQDFVAESFAACGAASGALAMGIARIRLASAPRERRPRILAYASSDRGSIGACVLAAASGRDDVSALQRGASTRRALPAPSREAAAFNRVRHEGHLEEIGSKLGERRFELRTGRTLWSELTGLEAQIEAHLAALVSGGDPAFELARAATAEQDEERCSGAVRLLVGAHGNPDDALAVQRALVQLPYPSEAWTLVEDAMRFGQNPHLAGALHQLLESPLDEAKRIALADWLGRSRHLDVERMAALMRSDSSPQLRAYAALAVARASARTDSEDTITLAKLFPKNEVLLEALLRLGLTGALARLRWAFGQADRRAGHVRLLGLTGDRSDLEGLHRLLPLADAALGEAAALALGALGFPESVPTLIENLAAADPPTRSVRSAVALALQRITAADLFEAEFVTEDDDESEPIGQKACEDSSRWEAWWEDNRQRFRGGTRYRRGTPYTFEGALDELEGSATPNLTIRRLAGDEIALRSGRGAANFEPEDPVAQQRQAIAVLRTWRA